MNELRRRSAAALDDDSVLLELARCVLGGPREEGRASYQVVLSECPECGNGRQQAAGGSCRSTLTSSGWPTVMPSTSARCRTRARRLPTTSSPTRAEATTQTRPIVQVRPQTLRCERAPEGARAPASNRTLTWARPLRRELLRRRAAPPGAAVPPLACASPGVPRKPSFPPCAARCCCAISIVARCQAATSLSYIVAEQVRTISTQRLSQRLGSVSKETLGRACSIVSALLGL